MDEFQKRYTSKGEQGRSTAKYTVMDTSVYRGIPAENYEPCWMPILRECLNEAYRRSKSTADK